MSKVRCPICDAAMPGHSQEYPDFPFCSRRCRIIDLGRWLGEDYRVAGKNAAESAPKDGSDED